MQLTTNNVSLWVYTTFVRLFTMECVVYSQAHTVKPYLSLWQKFWKTHFVNCNQRVLEHISSNIISSNINYYRGLTVLSYMSIFTRSKSALFDKVLLQFAISLFQKGLRICQDYNCLWFCSNWCAAAAFFLL